MQYELMWEPVDHGTARNRVLYFYNAINVSGLHLLTINTNRTHGSVTTITEEDYI